MRHTLDESNNSANEKANNLQDEIDKLVSKKQELETTKNEITIELLDTELFFTSLNDRKVALGNSRLTFSSLGQINFKYCPACLEPITDQSHSNCALCKTEKVDREKDIAYVQMLNELNFQIRESEALIKEFREQIDAINGLLPGINRRISEAKFEYNELETTANGKDAMISEIASEMGFCKSQMLALEDRRNHVKKVEALRQEKATANALILEIQDKLGQVNAMQAERYKETYEAIEEAASDLLAKDGSYEPTFDSAEDVSFDFAKDKMFVNGRNKFSASSMVVMKNSIRLAIFICAVNDKQARLPNFLMMDNIEDKGMVDERSQNFQRLIVESCEKLQYAHQLIFTTSMIAPELDGSSMCVGPMYKKGMHTLDFSYKN